MPADSVLAKAKYKIPLVVDADRVCVSVSVPNDPDHLANFFTALATLGLWSNYQLEDDRRAKPVADVWVEIFRLAEESLCDCGLRNGPKGIEQYNNHTGTWEPVTGNFSNGDPRTDGTVPAPWPIPPVGQTGNCLAAANIVQNLTDSNNKAAEILAAAAGFADLIVAFTNGIGLALPVVGEIFAIAADIATAAANAGAALWADTFTVSGSADQYHKLQCFLSCEIASDGRVSADAITRVKSEFAATFPGPWDGAEQALWLFVVNSYLDSLGPNGLTLMGAANNVHVADCSDCDCGWSHHFDFRTSDEGFTVYPGYTGHWVAGTGWVTDPLSVGGSAVITTLNIHKIALGTGNFTHGDMYFDWNIGHNDGGYGLGMEIFHSGVLGPYHVIATGDQADGTHLLLSIPLTSSDINEVYAVLTPGVGNAGDPGGHAVLTDIFLYGNGTDPF